MGADLRLCTLSADLSLHDFSQLDWRDRIRLIWCVVRGGKLTSQLNWIERSIEFGAVMKTATLEELKIVVDAKQLESDALDRGMALVMRQYNDRQPEVWVRNNMPEGGE